MDVIVLVFRIIISYKPRLMIPEFLLEQTLSKFYEKLIAVSERKT